MDLHPDPIPASTSFDAPGGNRHVVRDPGARVPRGRRPTSAWPVGLAALAVVVCAAVLVSTPAGAASTSQRLVLYSVAEQEQYVNNSDSRILGVGNNPFGNFRDVAPVTTKKSHGPFPGDEAVFSFNLYTNASLKKRAGTAVFTCQYNFNKNAFCDASFELTNGGTLIAAGGFNFNATKFTLAVTGSYGTFVNKTGVLEETSSANHAQRLVFRLT